MVLPDKHIRFSESLLGLGALVLDLLSSPKPIDSIWQDLKNIQSLESDLYSSHNFENLVLSVDLLFAMGLVALNNSGDLEKTTSNNTRLAN